MIIHFICRGNVFRSRMAEAYLNSLKITDIQAISSGALARQYAGENTIIEQDTISFLTKHGLEVFSKSHWNQLTQERVARADLTICMTPLVKEECQGVAELPGNTTTWNITDVGDEGATPQNKAELDDAYEQTFQKVTTKVDELIKQMP